MYRYVKGLNGKILDTYEQAVKYGMTVEQYWETFSFPNCEYSNNLKDLLPNTFGETIDFSPEIAPTRSETDVVEEFIKKNKLHIKLSVLFKALRFGIYFKNPKNDKISFVAPQYLYMNLRCLRVNENLHISFKQYGKTWALSKEELEN